MWNIRLVKRKEKNFRNVNQRQNILVHFIYYWIKTMAFNHKVQYSKDMLNLYQQFVSALQLER